MTDSLNIKQINHFLCGSVIIYRFEEKYNTHTHPIVRDKFRTQLVTNSEPV